MATAHQARDAPKAIEFDSIIVDVCFHPEKDIIASGDIDGDITLHSYSTTEDNHEVMSLTHHKKACRCLRFSPDGTKLYTASKDKSLCSVDLNKGAVSHKLRKAHEAPIYCMCVADENIIATGDDDGTLKVWDLRQENCVMDVKENDDFISDMVLEDKKRVLVATSGDGTLSAFDIRKHKLKLQSELFESELLSLAIVKGGEKVVCGSGEGALNIFNWGEWGNISDRFPGHPMSIDCMAAFNDNIIFTGSFDGSVRAVNLFPNRFLGVVGEHKDFPVENLSLSHCKTVLASCSHDQTIRFWNVSDVNNEKIDVTKKAKRSNKGKLINKSLVKDDFFAGFAEETKVQDDENDDSDDDDNDSDSSENNMEAGSSKIRSDSEQNQTETQNSSDKVEENSDDDSTCSSNESDDGD